MTHEPPDFGEAQRRAHQADITIFNIACQIGIITDDSGGQAPFLSLPNLSCNFYPNLVISRAGLASNQKPGEGGDLSPGNNFLNRYNHD